IVSLLGGGGRTTSRANHNRTTIAIAAGMAISARSCHDKPRSMRRGLLEVVIEDALQIGFASGRSTLCLHDGKRETYYVRRETCIVEKVTFAPKSTSSIN